MARLDGTYTRLLMRVKNLKWKLHFTKHRIYGTLPSISKVATERRLRLTGHRAKDQVISNLVLWQIPTPHRKGARPLSYPSTITRDTGILLDELPSAMANKIVWLSFVKNV